MKFETMETIVIMMAVKVIAQGLKTAGCEVEGHQQAKILVKIVHLDIIKIAQQIQHFELRNEEMEL